MKVKRKVFLIVALIFAALSNVSFAQNEAANYASLDAIPTDLRASLISRINLFTEAQKKGRWEQIAELLGEYRNIALNEKYTDKYKECIIEQI